MLIKDHILVERLTHLTKNIDITINLDFKFNNEIVNLEIIYTPDKYKLNQKSLITYLNKLTESEDFNLENLTAKIVEDLYDMAVPKKIKVNLSLLEDNIKTQINASKKQPSF